MPIRHLRFALLWAMGNLCTPATGTFSQMWRSVAIVFLIASLCPVAVHAETCTREDFEAVVDEAAAALNELNAKHKPAFQAQLRELKEKRGWDHDTFMREAAPFVQDEQIAMYDQETADYLARISSLGEEGAAAVKPDCKLLVEVRATMEGLVAAQQAKWSYMFEKIGQALRAQASSETSANQPQ